jgi:hypothetical protein
MNNLLKEFLESMLVQSPLLLVYLLIFIMALVRWQRARKASLLTLLSSVLLFLALAARTTWSILGFDYFYKRLEWSIDTVLTVSRIIHVLANLGEAFALGLLLWAIYSGRSPHQPAARRSGERRSAEPVAPPVVKLAPPEQESNSAG